MTLYEQIKLLHDNGLHSNVAALGSFALNIAASEVESDFTPSGQYLSMIYVGKSYQYLGENRRAESMYKNALQFAKVAIKNGAAKPSDLYKNGASEIDVKYALVECYSHVRDFTQAVSILESIPQRHRTAKINMALGKLYNQSGMERPAIVAYKEVLKECPMAMDAIQELLTLGVQGSEVISFVESLCSNSITTNWIKTWINGNASMHTRDYKQAVNSFKSISDTIALKRNSTVLTRLGEAYYYAGDSKNALNTLIKSHSNDPLNMKGIDLLAALLADEKRTRELESLAVDATSVSDCASEPWIAVGYYCQLTSRTTKGVYFAHKACSLNPRSVEGLLLKGTLLLELKKLQEAVMHFREAMQIDPHRFEPHKGLVECYVAMDRSREAVTVAVNAMKLNGHSARALTLYASVLVKDLSYMSKGRFILEKALKLEPYFLPAVYLLCENLMQEGNYATTIELLHKQVEVQSTYKLHQLLADCHTRIQDEEKASHHYSIALNLSNLNSGESRPKPPEPGVRVYAPVERLDFDVEDIGTSEEGDVEDNDLEAVWSDVDFSFNP